MASSATTRIASLSTGDDGKLMDFVKEVHSEVLRCHNEENANALGEALMESAAILSSAPRQTPRRFSRRLETCGEANNVSNLLICQPCASEENAASEESGDETAGDTEPDAVMSAGPSPAMPSAANTNALPPASVRFRLPRGQNWTTVRPAIPLEGAHEPRPTAGTTPAFLKSHFATDDEQDLSYVPYFGDDDGEDVVSELYNTEGRERMVECGPEYKERETNRVIEETLELADEQRGGVIGTRNAVSKKRIEGALATLLGIDPDRIHHRNPPHEGSPSASAKKATPETEYLGAIDSYRQCLCRRCFTYDCNMHGGCQGTPDVQLQGELAVEKERTGFWEKADAEENTESSDGESPHATGVRTTNDDSKKRSLADAVAYLDDEHAGMKDLTPLQKSVCERTFLIHQGDYDKMALTLGAPRKLVVDYVTSQGMNLNDFKHVRPDTQGESKKRKVGKKSMKSYNASWLKRVEDAEIHPFFVPCNHSGPCSEENCSCIKNRFFCTKQCGWGEKSRNFFKGCSCKGGKCGTKACACFAAKRECDPDLCISCGACTDPPSQPATNQRCRNDSISMRRHCQLLLAKSTVEDAGWGLFTKHALKKGDFVHEYVGEVISQEEAERRGLIYDKINCSYLFNLSSDLVVDASRKGNKTRFANHSDKPNCEIKMTWVNGDIRIGLFASCDIEPQSELFFDYRYDVAMDNDLINKPGITVDWMKDPKMANKVSRKDAA